MTSRKVHPLALKESKDRWYLIAIDTKDKILKSFGLDRINYLDVAKNQFREKYKYNFREHFKNAFGVMNLAEQKPQNIVLKCRENISEDFLFINHKRKPKKLRKRSILSSFFIPPTTLCRRFFLLEKK
jgi:predicted DNA-binding transcriptional regulator YafY